MWIIVVEFLLDCRDCVLGVCVPLSNGVADHHGARPVWLEQQLARGLLQEPVK